MKSENRSVRALQSRTGILLNDYIGKFYPEQEHDEKAVACVMRTDWAGAAVYAKLVLEMKIIVKSET